MEVSELLTLSLYPFGAFCFYFFYQFRNRNDSTQGKQRVDVGLPCHSMQAMGTSTPER